MKIEKDKEIFSPVTITLTTQKELDIFTTALSCIKGEAVIEEFGYCTAAYDKLVSVGGRDLCAKMEVLTSSIIIFNRVVEG